MMRICYLHAGTHRTGTTALQVALAKNAAALERAGLFVPSTGALDATGGSHNVALELLGSPRYDPALGSFADLLAAVSASAAPNTIVSSEIFQQLHANPASLRRFVDGMRAIGYETRVLFYLRSQAAYAESVYAVYAKMGYVVPFGQIVEEILRDGALGAGTGNVFLLAYAELLERFAAVVGPERMHVRAYPSRPGDPTLLDDVLEIALGKANGARDLIAIDRQNVSLTFEELMRTLDPGGVYADYGTGTLLRPSEALRFVRRFASDNRRVFRTYGVRVESVERRRLPAFVLAALGLNAGPAKRRAAVDRAVERLRSRARSPELLTANPAGELVDDDASELRALQRSLGRERARLDELAGARSVVRASVFSRIAEVSGAVRALVATPRENRGTSAPPPGAVDAAPAAIAPGRPESGRGDIETAVSRQAAYARWRTKFAPAAQDLRRMENQIGTFRDPPKISIVMATYETNADHLREAIDSVRAQVYPDWELCIADDASRAPHVRAMLLAAAASDPRIVVTFRRVNGNISQATNSALDLVTGTFVGFLDHDDLLTPDALFEIVRAIDDDPTVDLLYSDEDKVDDAGRLFDVHFKPDWCPDSFLSRNYLSHFSVYRRSIIEAAGRLRERFDGSQDYDLALRVVERTQNIAHVPKVLYHWRAHDESTAKRPASKPYAFEAARRAIAEALERRGEPGTVTALAHVPGTYIVRYEIRTPGTVSIIIPTRDHAADLERCLASIFARRSVVDFDVLIVDNGSVEASTFELFERWQRRDPRVRVVRHDVPFNFSEINNFAFDRTTGRYVLFLNNDTEVLSDDWLAAMVEQAQRPSIGAVGARLLYADGTIQHAGVVVGIGGVAGHSHKYFPEHAHGYFMMLETINNYSAVTGACLMVRRDVFEQAGRFDERLAVAFNDVDLCLRIGALGYRNVALPHVRLYHHESRSRGAETTPERQERFAAEIALMKERWKTTLVPDPCYSEHLTLVTEDFAIAVPA